MLPDGIVIFGTIARYAVCTTFALAFVHKISDVRSFRTAVAALLGVSDRAAALFSPLVVLAEATIIVTLAALPASRLPYGLTGLVLSAYSVAVLGATRSSRDVRCACFGAQNVVSVWDLLRNGVLVVLVIAAAAVVGSSTRFTGEARTAAVLAGAVTGWLVTRLSPMVQSIMPVAEVRR